MKRPVSDVGRFRAPRATDSETTDSFSTGSDRRDRQECEACGTRMYGLHCKIVCPNCGYKRDCSDP